MHVEIKSLLYLVVVPLFAYTNISREAVTILSILFAVDFLTAIIRENVTNPQGITSSEMKAGFTSKMVTLMIPFLISIVGKAAGYDLSMLANTTIGVFCLAEFYSVNGNIIQIREKDKTVTEYDAITILLKKLQQLIRGLVESIIEKISNTVKTK